ncbi:hypothetical protein AAG906_014405 [Vitis piasezkii]
MDLIKAGENRFLDLNEMEELRNNVYINSKVAKQRMKKWHDQLISNKEFRKGKSSMWIGPFVIHRVYSNGVVDLLNSNGKDSLRISRELKEKNRSKSEKKAEQKQGKTELCEISRLKETSAKWAFCCQIIPQHCRSLCEGISQLRNRGLAHDCETHCEMEKHDFAPKVLLRRNFAIAKWGFGTRVPLRSTVTSISQLRNTLRSCCENGKLLRNWRFVAKIKLTFGVPFFLFIPVICLRKGFQNRAPFSQPLRLLDEPRRPTSDHPLGSERVGQSLVARDGPNARSKVVISLNRKRGCEGATSKFAEPSPRPNPPPVQPAPPKPPRSDI